MKTGRRIFIKGLGAASVIASIPARSYSTQPSYTSGAQSHIGSKGLKLSYQTYDLQLRHTFTVSGFSRDTTPVVLTEIEYEGFTGYGEASMPPYLGESQESVITFLKKVDLGQFKDPFLLDEILEYVDSVDEENRAAKACIDIALHDLIGKMLDQPLHRLWGLNPEDTPMTSLTRTIEIDLREMLGEQDLPPAIGPKDGFVM